MILDPILDLFRGKAVTIAPMDGALKPNTLLEDAQMLATAERPDSLVFDGASVIYASGSTLRRLGGDAMVKDYGSVITALAMSPHGMLAVGLNSGAVMLGDAVVDGFNCPTALGFDGDDLLVCNGSENFAPEDWVKDLMQGKPSGSLWRVKATAKDRSCLARGLAYPNGVVADRRSQRVVFSESWLHRLAAVPSSGGAVTPVLPRLPAYPCRITTTPSGYLLALFAPLNRLVEFVLQEHDYRAAMMREIESRFWIAPTLAASRSFLEPLQNGGVKSMGVHKPWSPTRSYGLLVTLDHDFRPVASFHSRANGHYHGVTSAVAVTGNYIVASKGGNAILSINAADGGA
jgi:hypothetical protein